jgi:hypothetical protein
MVRTAAAATKPLALAGCSGARLCPAPAVPQLAAELIFQVAPLERLGIEPLAIGIGLSLGFEARIFLGHAAGSPSISPALFVSHLDPMTRYARAGVESRVRAWLVYAAPRAWPRRGKSEMLCKLRCEHPG